MENSLLQSLRSEVRAAPESGIVEVVNAAREREDLIPLWVGEGDLPTPDFICAAAEKSLHDGETFYTYQRGIPALRQALADYHAELYPAFDFTPERFFVTGSGMQAIQLAVRCVAGPGDEVIYPEPAWPNLPAAAALTGARPVPVPMIAGQGGWTLDIDELFAAVSERTTAIFLNTPCNPTGWVAGHDLLRDILDRARQRGIWIIADEVYGRFYYGEGAAAPSFYDVARPDDRILFVNTFSKNWAMTGWRVGWLSAPPAIGQVVENLIQYSTSGVPVFSQRAAVAALTEGKSFLQEQLARAQAGREIITSALREIPSVNFTMPEGAFYLFLKVAEKADSRRFALELVSATGVGLAPGYAFGNAGEGYLRLCFACSADRLKEAGLRLRNFLATD